MIFLRRISPRTDGPPRLNERVPSGSHCAGTNAAPGYAKPVRCEPRWRAAEPSLQQAVSRLTTLIEQTEPTRQRRRRPADAANFHRAVECIACNILAVSLAAPDRPLAVPLANSASRLVPIFGKPARKVIDLMIAQGLVTKVRGYPYRGPTTIRATPELGKHLPLGAAKWAALRLEDHAAVVVLKPRASEEPDGDGGTQAPARPRSAATSRWLPTITEQMHEINVAILNAPIECKGSAVAHVAERPGGAMASLVTLHHRALRRIFNGSYEEGGRLFGGFWQTMPRPDRFKHIRISGEPIAICDYSQLFLRLAYAEAGVTPPAGDLYAISSEETSKPGWKRLREARKKLVNAMFFAKAPLKQWPGASLEEIGEMRGAFPAGTKPRDAVRAIKERHTPIAHLFEQGHGLRFMRVESDLIVTVTLALLQRGIVALPIHDAVAVRRSDAETARAIMQDEARRSTSAGIPVGIQTSGW